jgi:phosphatidylinositol glycan class H protein
MTTLITILKRLASPPAQSLQNFQPTPATVTYTVSTRPVAKTLPATVASYVGIAVRIAIALAGTLALWMKWVVSSRKSLEVVNQVFGRMVEDRLVKGVGEIRGEYMVPVVLCALWFVCKRGYVGMYYSASASSAHLFNLSYILIMCRGICNCSERPWAPN